MKVVIAVAVVFLWAGQAQCLAATPTGETDKKIYHDELVDLLLANAQDAGRSGDFAHAVSILAKIMEPSIYSQLSPTRQHQILTLFGTASVRIGDWTNAHEAFKIATDSPAINRAANRYECRVRLLTARMVNDSADAFASFEHLRVESLDFIADFSLAEVQDLDEQFSSLQDGEQARLALGEALDEAKWQPPDPFVDAGGIWFQYATALIEKGQIDKAALVAKRITDPMTIILMRADRRFDPIVATDPDRFDPVKAGESWLATVRRAANEHPNYLEGQTAVARALHILGRNEEALQVLDAALVELGRGMSNRQSRFVDFSGATGFALSWKSEILFSLGKVDEGLATLKTILTIPWEKGLNFDLTLASRLNVFDRPEEALTYLEGPGNGDLSFRRPILLAEVRACTFAHVNRAKELHEELEYLRAHRAERPDELELAQLCANDQDGVAATIIAMLHNPRERAWALGELQVFSDKGIAPYSKVLRSRMKAIRIRPDVRAALAPVGRSLSYDLPRY